MTPGVGFINPLWVKTEYSFRIDPSFGSAAEVPSPAGDVAGSRSRRVGVYEAANALYKDAQYSRFKEINAHIKRLGQEEGKVPA